MAKGLAILKNKAAIEVTVTTIVMVALLFIYGNTGRDIVASYCLIRLLLPLLMPKKAIDKKNPEG